MYFVIQAEQLINTGSYVMLALVKYLAAMVLGAALSVAVLTQYLGYQFVKAGEFAAMKAAQATLEKIRSHNESKKAVAKKKMAQKAGKRLSTGVIASATVGSLLVSATSIGFLVQDYCDEQKEIHELDAMLDGSTSNFDFAECAKVTKSEAGAWIQAGLDDLPSTLSKEGQRLREELGDLVDIVSKYVSNLGKNAVAKIFE
jgi:hypothetical protein